MKTNSALILISLFVSCLTTFAQDPDVFERPVNFFFAAGFNTGVIGGDLYEVTISPIDYTVQFDQIKGVTTKLTTGVMWNPFNFKEDKRNNKKMLIKGSNQEVVKKNPFVVALLLNVYQLNFNQSDLKTNVPLDMGIGMGIRFSNFAVLGTVEFTPYRVPRDYFAKEFQNKNKQLIMAGSQEPEKTIDTDDNAIFMNKVYVSFGLKVAYAFTNTKEKK